MKRHVDIKKAQEKLCSLVDHDIIDMAEAFKKAGHSFYMVGGCVRDSLLGLDPKDIDFCTDAVPEQSLAIIRNIPGITHVQLHGESFAVVVAYSERHPEGMEIASFRVDVTEGRHPEVKVGVTIDEDVKRRDFTINAMYFDINAEKIIDTVGGIEDLRNGLIRCVGNPVDRFREDPLRKLRCFRFAARFDFRIDDDTWAALMADPSLPISRQRIFNELMTTLSKASDFYCLLFNIDSCGIIHHIFQDIKINVNIGINDSEINTPTLFLAHVLNGVPSSVIRAMVKTHNFEARLVNGILFLRSLKAGELSAEKITKIWSARKSCDVTDWEVLIYTNSSVETKAMLSITFDSNVSQTFMAQGLKERALGEAIDRHYFDLYKLELDKISGTIL